MEKELKEYHSLIKDLQALKNIKASRQLKHRVNHLLVNTLPQKKRFFYSPFLAFRPLTLAILLLIFMGSGIVAASQNTKPGDFLYPVKAVVNGLINKNTPTSSPTPVFHSLSPSPSPSPADELIEYPERILEINGSPNPVKPTLIPVKNEIIPTVSIPLITPTPIIDVQEPLPLPTEITLPVVNLNINIGGLKIGL